VAHIDRIAQAFAQQDREQAIADALDRVRKVREAGNVSGAR
jgi:hypothetical protein